jgi:uncharacterized HAD superfamily protein
MKAERTLTIGIDIDGTVTDPSSIVPLMNESFGKNLRFDDCIDYNLATVYEISDEDFIRWLKTNGERLYDVAPVHGNADQILRQWHNHHQLIYISAREEKHMPVTLHWFERYQIPFHHIELLGSHDKLAAAKKWQLDLFIEDRLENALQISESLRIPVFLFDTPYNQGELPDLVHRVRTWEEIAERMDRLKR